ncbi:MAG: hypothetical protein ACOC1G_00760 [Phycisphaeraceae bacterium]
MASTQTRFIDVNGSLRLDTGGVAVRVEASGPRLRVVLNDDAALAAMLQGLPHASSKRRRIAQISGMLDRLGLTAEIVVDGNTVLSAGHDVSPSISAKLARLGPLDAKLATLVKMYRMQK